MFFAKFFVPAVALFSAATGVFATPVAHSSTTELSKRASGQDVHDVCQHTYDQCDPLIAELAVTADVTATVKAIADVFVNAQVELDAYVGVDVSAYVAAIVDINIQLLVKLFVAISTCGGITAALLVQIDAFIGAYLAVLAKINADICVQIGVGLPASCIQILVSLKLVVVIVVCGLLNLIGDILSLL